MKLDDVIDGECLCLRQRAGGVPYDRHIVGHELRLLRDTSDRFGLGEFRESHLLC